ncbi:MAG: ribonuclease Y [Candidatus Buchananbacteria bacterium RBG_13_39_9]|uniref:Ribonuclease Y n=1 Tax=Candidatus Buchananbacteria bacterium RBG_13_39_9 TaxID=1797531 RepID=A0A1G1XPR7_9BACT|nr:MAG: ribonuclease Y [Candidatus Buchananbacteria bacterium RBG_13_39_9]
MDTLNFVISAIAILGGFAIGYFVRKYIAKREIEGAEAKAEHLINEAKNKQKEYLLQAKDKAIKIIDDAKREEQQRRGELLHLQQRLEKRESIFDQKLLDLENKQQKLLDRAKEIEEVKEKINRIRDEQLQKLEKIAKMTKDQAKEVLLENTERIAKDDILARLRKIQNEGQDEIDKKAKEILSLSIQRCSTSHAQEIATTTVDLPSDEMKGRIIGREGRNIRAIEQLTGVEIVVDDTPMAITISGFSPIRRHVAKRALDSLISDGRIHPGRIEEAIENAKKEIALEIKKAGEDALYEMGITGIDPKLVQILGRLKFRTSYGHNVLLHSLEVAHLAGLLAEELKADVTICKKGGLFHDIGKAVDHEVKGGHPEIGYDIMKKFNMPEDIAYMCIAHHEDNPKTLEGIIVKVADAISGARPGARKDTYERYLQRLEELENVANAFAGVQKSYAIQAGREVRVFVVPEQIDDLEAAKLAQNIAHKIEEELKYPGEIKVNVIREMRITEYAR